MWCVLAQSCPTLGDPKVYSLPGSCPWDSPDKNTGVGHRILLQGIFQTQGSNPHLLHLLHWQADSLPLSHCGSSVVPWGVTHGSFISCFFPFLGIGAEIAGTEVGGSLLSICGDMPLTHSLCSASPFLMFII